MKKYYPILISKPGELTALHRLTQNVKNQICPIIEVIPDKVRKQGKPSKTGKPKKERPNIMENLRNFLITHWNFNNNQVILDFSWYENLEQNTTTIRSLFNALFNAGVNAIPAIQANSPSSYITLVETLIANNQSPVCVRTSNRSGGFVNYNNSVNDLIAQINTVPANTILLLDLGYAQLNDHAMLASVADVSINSIRPTKNHWKGIIIAAGSFPEDLTDFPARVAPYRLRRYEWDIWAILRTAHPNIRYGDFGTKYPFYSEAGFAGSISIKYTVQTEFVIYRGVLTEDHPHGHGQYITHAHRLVNSTDFYGFNFSWGDLQISHIAIENVNAPNRRTGSPTTWVEYSQNHHITLLQSLL